MTATVPEVKQTVALTGDQLTAIKFIEVLCEKAKNREMLDNLYLWINPNNDSDQYNRTLREIILGEPPYKIPQGFHGTWREGLDAYYKTIIRTLKPIVEGRAQAWALDIIRKEKSKLLALLLIVNNNTHAKVLNTVAKEVQAYARNTELSPLTRSEYLEVTGKSGGSGTVSSRLKRTKYMRFLKTKGNKTLLSLMAHPLGVEIVDEFTREVSKGQAFATEIITESIQALNAMRERFADRAIIWRFPPTVYGGIAASELAKYPAMTKFWLAWTLTEKGTIENALDIASNAIFAIGLFGPLGKAISEVLDLVLGIISLSVSLIRGFEQDQAAVATAFSEDPGKLSKGSNKGELILKGTAAILSSLAIPGTISNITQRPSKAKALVPSAKDLKRGQIPYALGVKSDAPRSIEERAIRTRISGAGLSVGSTRNIERRASSAERLNTRIPNELNKQRSTTLELTAEEHGLTREIDEAFQESHYTPTVSPTIRLPTARGFIFLNRNQPQVLGRLLGRNLSSAASSITQETLQQAETVASNLAGRIKAHWDAALTAAGETGEQAARRVFNNLIKLQPPNPNQWVRVRLYNRWRERAMRRISLDMDLVRDLKKEAGIIIGRNPKTGTISMHIRTKSVAGERVQTPIDFDHGPIGHENAVNDAWNSNNFSPLISTVSSNNLSLMTGRENRNFIEEIRKAERKMREVSRPIQ